MIYLDNASTSLPKPPCVLQSLERCNTSGLGNPHRTQASETSYVEEARHLMGSLLNLPCPSTLSFTFNATHGLNTVLKGYIKANDHIILSTYEHNAVLRPLEVLKKEKNITTTVIETSPFHPEFQKSLEAARTPRTTLIVWNHASNVTGDIFPLKELLTWSKRHNIASVIDCAQTVGHVPLNVKDLDMDFLVGTCHKGLMSLPGLGFLYVKRADTTATLMEGGSGYHSHMLTHPAYAPFKFEAGTLNYFAIYSLLDLIPLIQNNQSAHQKHLHHLGTFIEDKLKTLPQVIRYGHTFQGHDKCPILSFNIQGVSPGHVASVLHQEYGIVTRPGIHCAPLAHKILGTYPLGTLRISWSIYTTEKDMVKFFNSLQKIILHL